MAQATFERRAAPDREATIVVFYLVLTFALDSFLAHYRMSPTPFPWFFSQAMGLALLVTLGLRYWFVIFASVFLNGFVIWQEGRSISVMFLAVITSLSYLLGAYLWKKIEGSKTHMLGRAMLFVGLCLSVSFIVSRLTWSLLTRYGMMESASARVWVSQLTLRDGLDLVFSFPFYALVLFPFLTKLTSLKNEDKFRLTTWLQLAQEGLFVTLPFLTLAIPNFGIADTDLLYLLFLPALFVLYFFKLRGTLAFSFAIHLWLYKAWPFDESGAMSSAVTFQIAFYPSLLLVAYLFDRDKKRSQENLDKQKVELQLAHKHILELEENRREWRALTQTLERLVVRSTQDLRTPLTPIYMWSQILKEGSSSQEVQDASDGIQLSIERQTKMLEELRDSVRVSMGHQTIRLDTFDLAELLSELAETWKNEAAHRKLEFRYERPLKSSLVQGDRDQLRLALHKLFEHLLQFGSQDANISLHASTQHRDIVLHLKHSGYASDQQHVLKLLQAGQGMDQEALMTAANFDLALYTAKKLIDLQGGRLTAASLNPKPGMLFSLSLQRGGRDAKASPSREPLNFHATISDTLGQASESSEKQSLLIVEDDPFTLHLLDSLLANEGLDIVACSNSTEAMEAFFKLKPGIVLTDLGLPDINGFELVRRLKRTSPHEFIAIAFSAAATPEAQQQAMEAGFSAFLEKPLQTKDLLETMQKFRLSPKTYKSEAPLH